MKSINRLLFLIILLQSCTGQVAPERKIYNKEFNWSVTIPENFEQVSAEQWARIQNKGADAIENTYNKEIKERPVILFVFKSDQLNYLESNYQPFDTAIDGNYLESCRNLDDVLYQTFTTQLPGVKLDTMRTTEKIDDLLFQVSKTTIHYPNKMVMHALMYSRLFDKKDFSVNIMYVDEAKGELMIRAWRNSRFSKK